MVRGFQETHTHPAIREVTGVKQQVSGGSFPLQGGAER